MILGILKGWRDTGKSKSWLMSRALEIRLLGAYSIEKRSSLGLNQVLFLKLLSLRQIPFRRWICV